MLPFACHRLCRRVQAQKATLPAKVVFFKAKGIAQKIQTLPCFAQLHHAGFLAVSVVSPSHPSSFSSMNFPQSSSLITRQHHKVVRIPDQFGSSPLGRAHPFRETLCRTNAGRYSPAMAKSLLLEASRSHCVAPSVCRRLFAGGSTSTGASSHNPYQVQHRAGPRPAFPRTSANLSCGIESK